MKICLVAPGFMPIPTSGWGAIENIIWDYKFFLEKLGDEVFIVNNSDSSETLNQINSLNCDVCHCHFDWYIDELKRCNSKLKIISTHYGTIRTCLNMPLDQWHTIMVKQVFPKFADNNVYVCALDSFIRDFFINHYKVCGSKIFVTPNGARDDLIQFSEVPKTTQSICIGKIQWRKRQYLLKDLDVKLIGELSDNSLDKSNKNLIGMWNREQIYSDLTHNSNLVLLSQSEAAPLVTVEALTAGLGLVISETSTANLDLSKPFIDVIPENKITDIDYISKVIDKNKDISLSMRKSIREYAEENFSLRTLVKNYKQTIESLL